MRSIYTPSIQWGGSCLRDHQADASDVKGNMANMP